MDGAVSEKSHGKRVKVLVDAMPKANTGLPDAALPCGMQYCGRERAGRTYTAVVRGAKMEILVEIA